MSHRAVLIAGPTASGKSAYALKQAAKDGGCIINTDSMQVYRDLQIISARPSEDETKLVPHHLYGHVDGVVNYSTGNWLRDVTTRVARLEQATIYFVGGTGLYFSALLDGFAEIPDIDGVYVKALETELEGLDERGRRALLDQEDPQFAASLKVADPQRTIRALSVIRQTGKSLLQWQQEAQAAPLLKDWDVNKIVLMSPRDVLYERINQRVELMLETGGLDEVRALLDKKLPSHNPVMKAIGVPELSDYLEEKLDLPTAKRLMAQHTRNYAKRQMTWFRNRFGDWRFVDPLQDKEST